MTSDDLGKKVNINMFKHSDQKFYGIYRGKVLDNNDPLQLGRLKIEILPMLKGLIADQLPWAASGMPIFDGSGSGSGEFNIPKIDTWLWCFFEAGDHNQPVYFAEAPDGIHGIPASAKTNYPNRKVKKTSGGIEIIIDDYANSIIINHPSGTIVTIDPTGVATSVVGTVNIEAFGEVNIEGSDVNIKGSTINLN